MSKQRAVKMDLANVAYKNEKVRERKLTHDDVKAVVGAMEDAIIKNLEEFHEINFLNLFYITVKKRKGWKAYDFNDPESKTDESKRITIPDFNVLNFKPTDKLKKCIKNIDLEK